jgi:hypothetical protein
MTRARIPRARLPRPLDVSPWQIGRMALRDKAPLNDPLAEIALSGAAQSGGANGSMPADRNRAGAPKNIALRAETRTKPA